MRDRIVVEGVRALGRHGARTGERDHPQPFDVDVTIDLDSPPEDDELSEVVDYSIVVAEVRRVVGEESFALVETLAAAIAERVLRLGAARVEVRVAKPAAAAHLGASRIAVELVRPA